ncbi:MAG: hypothetical protein V1656_01375 [Candidatus Jorgensenbacteria bacterium]
MKTIRTLAAVTFIALSTMPFAALAQGVLYDKPPDSVISREGATGIFTIYKTLTSWMWGILLALAVIFILYSAFLFLTSGGNEEKVKAAKNYLIYAVVAVAVGILATGIVALVGMLLNPPAAPPSAA